MTTSFHKSNLGAFGEHLVTDMDGYVHLTAEEWLDAPIDFAGETWSEDALDGWAEIQAEEARKAVAAAEAALHNWREGHSGVVSNQEASGRRD